MAARTSSARGSSSPGGASCCSRCSAPLVTNDCRPLGLRASSTSSRRSRCLSSGGGSDASTNASSDGAVAALRSTALTAALALRNSSGCLAGSARLYSSTSCVSAPASISGPPVASMCCAICSTAHAATPATWSSPCLSASITGAPVPASTTALATAALYVHIEPTIMAPATRPTELPASRPMYLVRQPGAPAFVTTSARSGVFCTACSSSAAALCRMPWFILSVSSCTAVPSTPWLATLLASSSWCEQICASALSAAALMSGGVLAPRTMAVNGSSTLCRSSASASLGPPAATWLSDSTSERSSVCGEPGTDKSATSSCNRLSSQIAAACSGLD
mmetsp:Transcript_12315/g.30126  ORF Transcript_12315/g.30126 Transcript_12315/m.30126 type:complete len:335 (-) Transcript_12315:520-1524(-)